MALSTIQGKLLIALAVCCFQTETVSACESEVMEIPNLQRRLRTYWTAPYEKRISDDPLEARWYMAEGFIMSSSQEPPQRGNCSTFYPVYLTEPLDPALLDATSQTVRVQIGGLTTGASNPAASYDIQVRKCSGEIQYFLEPVPIPYAAYCFDPLDEANAEVNELDDTFLSLIQSYGYMEPYINADLEFETETIGGQSMNVPYIKLHCFNHYAWDLGWIGYTEYDYKYLWFVDDTYIATIGPYSSLDIDYYQTGWLHEKVLTENGYGLGSSVRCEIHFNATSNSTYHVTSRPFVLGDNGYPYHLYSGSTNNFYLYPNIPLGCTSQEGDGDYFCTLHADILDDTGNSVCKDNRVHDTHHSLCGVELLGVTKLGYETYGSWYYHNTNENGVYVERGVAILLDENDDQTMQSEMRLRLRVGAGSGNTFWEGRIFPDIQILINSFQYYVPYPHPDPWMFGMEDLDLSCYSYSTNLNIYHSDGLSSDIPYTEVGEYFLLRLSKSLIEVQVRTKDCGSNICVCAVVIRIKNDVLLLDFCEEQALSGLIQGQGRHIRSQDWSTGYHYFWFNKNIGSLFLYCQISTGGDSVYFDFQAYGYLADESCEGLCAPHASGALIHRDGSSSNDNEQFLQSWKTTERESLFNPFELQLYSYQEDINYCVCPGENREIPDRVEYNDNYHFINTGAVLCSVSEGLVCIETEGGAVWPNTLLPDYMISGIEIVPSFHPIDPCFQLQCSFSTESTSSYTYNVSWYISGTRVYEWSRLTANEAFNTYLTPYHIQALFSIGASFRLTDELKCGISVESMEGELLVNTVQSASFYPIQPKTPIITLVRGTEALIVYDLNVPYMCRSSTGSPFELEFRIYDPEDSYGCDDSTIAVRGDRGCGAQIPSKQIGLAELTPVSRESVSLAITTKNDEKYQLKNLFNMKAKAVVTGDPSSIWNLELPNIEIHVNEAIEAKGSKCFAYVDPHMGTIDGMYYENQNEGEFIMYRHKHKQLEVQIKTGRCNMYATCVCAVAVRAGGDVFVIDHCTKKKHITQFYSELDYILNPYVRKYQRYQIVLPSTSTMVDIVSFPSWNYWMNVDIYMSPSDMNQVEGLCGNFNGNSADDLMGRDGTLYNTFPGGHADEFSQSWELTGYESESLFNPYILPSRWKTNNKLCVCPNENSNTGGLDYLCSANEDRTCTGPTKRKGKLFLNRNRDRRSGQLHSHLKKRYAADPSEYVTRNIVKRSTHPLAMTEAEASQICSQDFSSNCTLFDTCVQNSDEIKADTDAVFRNCVQDLMYEGNSNWTTTHCNSLKTCVEKELDKSPEFVKNNPTIVSDIEDTYCLDNCNGHGTCEKGDCICEGDYIGDTCHIPKSRPPTVFYVPETCDKSTVSCECSFLEGEDFVTDTTVCKFEYREQINATEEFQLKGTDITNAEVGDLTYAYCCRPSSRKRRSASTVFASKYALSVSNDGINYGPTQTVFILDTSCQETVSLPSGATQVVLMPGFCFINGECKSEYSSNPGDPCDVCDPNISAYEWTPSGCAIAEEDDDLNDMIIVYIVVPVALVLVIGIVATILFIKFKHARPIEPYTDSTKHDQAPWHIEVGKPRFAWPNNYPGSSIHDSLEVTDKEQADG